MPTIKISRQLSNRVARAAKKAGITAHAFMVQSVARQTDLAEQRQAFVGEALEAEAELMRTGEGYRAADVHAWIQGRLAGKKPARPKARAWRK